MGNGVKSGIGRGLASIGQSIGAGLERRTVRSEKKFKDIQAGIENGVVDSPQKIVILGRGLVSDDDLGVLQTMFTAKQASDQKRAEARTQFFQGAGGNSDFTNAQIAQFGLGADFTPSETKTLMDISAPTQQPESPAIDFFRRGGDFLQVQKYMSTLTPAARKEFQDKYGIIYYDIEKPPPKPSTVLKDSRNVQSKFVNVQEKNLIEVMKTKAWARRTDGLDPNHPASIKAQQFIVDIATAKEALNYRSDRPLDEDAYKAFTKKVADFNKFLAEKQPEETPTTPPVSKDVLGNYLKEMFFGTDSVSAPTTGGVLMQDANGNRAIVDPNTGEVIKEL